jgi:hypothetical protein
MNSVYAYPPNTNVTVVYLLQPPRPLVSESVVVPVPAEREEYMPARQVMYLIAFKNGTVRAADQYWVNGSTLCYVTPDHQWRTAPVDSVDRTVSEQLNSQQNVAFTLPREQGKAVAQAHVIRRTASVVHKRQYCASR